mmetsp:Transcript_10341/g.19614  ORF Transcript_10341/g.19614 Transcript_10341/m.19614 type:complete len:208 (-) Transcript_10341:549-1172(-)
MHAHAAKTRRRGALQHQIPCFLTVVQRVIKLELVAFLLSVHQQRVHLLGHRHRFLQLQATGSADVVRLARGNTPAALTLAGKSTKHDVLHGHVCVRGGDATRAVASEKVSLLELCTSHKHRLTQLHVRDGDFLPRGYVRSRPENPCDAFKDKGSIRHARVIHHCHPKIQSLANWPDFFITNGVSITRYCAQKLCCLFRGQLQVVRHE